MKMYLLSSIKKRLEILVFVWGKIWLFNHSVQLEILNIFADKPEESHISLSLHIIITVELELVYGGRRQSFFNFKKLHFTSRRKNLTTTISRSVIEKQRFKISVPTANISTSVLRTLNRIIH